MFFWQKRLPPTASTDVQQSVTIVRQVFQASSTLLNYPSGNQLKSSITSWFSKN